MSSVRNSSIRTSRSTCTMRAPHQRRESDWQFPMVRLELRYPLPGHLLKGASCYPRLHLPEAGQPCNTADPSAHHQKEVQVPWHVQSCLRAKLTFSPAMHTLRMYTRVSSGSTAYSVAMMPRK